MNRTILIIDDDKNQAEQLQKALKAAIHNSNVECAYLESDIQEKILSVYYTLAVVDLRMDKYKLDGFGIMDQISVINPYAKIIAISAYTKEYYTKLSEYIVKGKILAISEKGAWESWIPELTKIIDGYFSKDINPITVQSLIDIYSYAKNEKDAFLKGERFENFSAVLFRQMGFKSIRTRVRDSASDEKDLIVRNDIDDPFFSKFGPYIFVECKNKPIEGFSKNDFIIFYDKIQSSSGDCDLGIVMTTGYIKSTVAREALKDSKFSKKIVFLSQPEIQRLINAGGNILDEFKAIIDEQK